MKKIFSNARKPEGRIGRIMASGMNGGSHERMAGWGMSRFRIHGDVLDMGCGGGGEHRQDAVDGRSLDLEGDRLL